MPDIYHLYKLEKGRITVFDIRRTNEITRDNAHHVLWVQGEGGRKRPGEFYERLIRAAFQADPANLLKIAQGFPGIAQAVYQVKQNLNGVQVLLEIANGDPEKEGNIAKGMKFTISYRKVRKDGSEPATDGVLEMSFPDFEHQDVEMVKKEILPHAFMDLMKSDPTSSAYLFFIVNSELKE